MFDFETTEGLGSVATGIGQDRGIKALEFGVNVDVRGYNMYLEGPDGVGKTKYTKDYLQKISKKKKTPCDWCYIYNFENPNEPIAVSFPAGQGKVFKETMESFVKDIRRDIKKTFNNDDFEKEKALIKQEFEAKRALLLEKLTLFLLFLEFFYLNLLKFLLLIHYFFYLDLLNKFLLSLNKLVLYVNKELSF